MPESMKRNASTMGFCGSRFDAMSVEDGVLQNECFVDVLNIIPHATILLIGVFIVTVWNHSVMGKLKAKTWVHFQGHNFRWVLTIALLFVIIIEVAEGVISDAKDRDSTNYHAFIPQCLAWLGVLIGIIYYHKVEMWNSPKFCLLLLIYWPSSFSLKFLKVFSMYKNNITWEHLKMWLGWIVIILYIAIFIVELNLLRCQRYAFFKHHRRLKPPEDLERTRYIQSYVNFLSKAVFWWVTDIMIQGYKRPLTLNDLGSLPRSERAVKQYDKLQTIFEEEKAKALKAKKNPSLTKSYMKAFWRMLLLATVYKTLGDVLSFVGPVCIEYIINYAYDVVNRESYANVTLVKSPTVTVGQFFWNGYTLAVVVFLASVLQHTFLQNYYYLVVREAVRLRSAIQAMVYSKALKLSCLTLSSGQQSIGQIMNHMSVDATFLMYFFFFMHYLYAVPIQVAIALAIMYWKLGYIALIGGLFVVACAPVMYLLGFCISKMQKQVLLKSDLRVRKVNEVIQGIRVVKLQAWEDAFIHSVRHTRKQELKHLIQQACFKGFMGVIGMSAPVIGSMLTFVLHVTLTSEPLTAGKVLSVLALFNLLSGPLQLLTLMSEAVANARVSCRRLTPYFLAPEVAYTPSAHSLGRCASSIAPDPMSEHSDKHESLNMDRGDSYLEMLPLHHQENASCRSSMTSLASAGVGTKPYSRQNSGDSLMDGLDFRLGNINRNATSAELLEVKPLTLMRKSSAPLLSSGEGHSDYKRRRHHSGVSSADIAEMAEDLVFMELRPAVSISSANFSWNLETKAVFLKDIDLKIPMGKLTMIVGQVGSGKSSLLAAMLGEMVKVSGSVDWANDIKLAFVAQTPWLLNATLRENILFGSQYVWRKYKKVITACALQPDFDQLPDGDMTEIGERGINLSGGQKQRVSIARALYSGADVVIMDDPLSALDAHVGRVVFEEAILKRLVKRKKTVIMVSHHVQYLSQTNKVIVMQDGQIYYQGKVSEVKKIDPDLYESWRKSIKDARASEHRFELEHLSMDKKLSSSGSIGHESLARPSSAQSSQLSVPGLNSRKMSQMSQMSVMTEASNEEQAEQDDDERERLDGDTDKGRIIKAEHKESGAVAASVYLRYFQACSIFLCVISICVQVGYHAVLIAINFWLTMWSSTSTQAAHQRMQGHNAGLTVTTQENVTSFRGTEPGTTTLNSESVSQSNLHFIKMYTSLTGASVIAAFIATLIVLLSATNGAKVLYMNLLRNVIYLPVRFFDTNPSGRILNRFSSDITAIDQRLGSSIETLMRCIFYCISAIIVNSVTTPYFLFAAVPLTICYYLLQRFFRSTSRELQRLDSITKSPIFAHFSETLSGLQTIRAYRAEREFHRRALRAIDTNVAPFLFLQTANRWLGIRLDYMSCLLMFASTIASVSTGISGLASPAFVGLCITYSLMISGQLNWIVRISTDVEMAMNAVERVLEYTDLPPESQQAKDEHQDAVDELWPPKGCVEFNQVTLVYDEELDPVLSNASFVIKAGEKVGVCGRTGSGKTSTVLALFRMLDIMNGEILIDNTNISRIPLNQLRSRLAIIPQDPVLFTGTIRFNLDPVGKWPDSRLWEALEVVQMKNVIIELPEKLEAQVTEGGENFSVGQRQLLCMARAIVRNSRIVILDEATASIDLETEQRVQDIIHGADFRDRTVITIAHRISTIISYDRVMVLDYGSLREFASPAELLADPSSMFSSLAHAASATASSGKKPDNKMNSKH